MLHTLSENNMSESASTYFEYHERQKYYVRVENKSASSIFSEFCAIKSPSFQVIKKIFRRENHQKCRDENRSFRIFPFMTDTISQKKKELKFHLSLKIRYDIRDNPT